MPWFSTLVFLPRWCGLVGGLDPWCFHNFSTKSHCVSGHQTLALPHCWQGQQAHDQREGQGWGQGDGPWGGILNGSHQDEGNRRELPWKGHGTYRKVLGGSRRSFQMHLLMTSSSKVYRWSSKCISFFFQFKGGRFCDESIGAGCRYCFAFRSFP